MRLPGKLRLLAKLAAILLGGQLRQVGPIGELATWRPCSLPGPSRLATPLGELGQRLPVGANTSGRAGGRAGALKRVGRASVRLESLFVCPLCRRRCSLAVMRAGGGCSGGASCCCCCWWQSFASAASESCARLFVCSLACSLTRWHQTRPLFGANSVHVQATLEPLCALGNSRKD